MEFALGSKYAVADITFAYDKSGQKHLLVAVKQTWAIQENDKAVKPIKAVPLQMADLHLGEPGLSPPLYDSDFSLKKNRCDVIFNATAYTPENKPLTLFAVGYWIGEHKKAVRIVGRRHWKQGVLGLSVSNPEPFTEMPLHYGLAFGGARPFKQGTKELWHTYETNPVGTGYCPNLDDPTLDGMPLPCLEPYDPNIKALDHPRQHYPAVALSAIGRHWLPRRQYGGTYDDKWQQEIAPFLPEDFDARYHQCAPEDQQIPFPKGGEAVRIMYMNKARPEMKFKLPRLTMPVRILLKDFSVHFPQTVVDTLYFEPDQERFSAVWRASLPLKHGIKEIEAIAIAGVCKNWWEAKIIGAAGCANCARKRPTNGPAPSEEDCDEAPAA